MAFLLNDPQIKEEFNFSSSSFSNQGSNGGNVGGDGMTLLTGECDEDLSLSADSEDSSGNLMASASEETFGAEFAAAESFLQNQGTQSPSLDSRGLPKKLCLVCNDFASGLHYGIPSCEACKAFFKRTVQGNVEYTCSANEDCEITKRRRKACQACRYRKCLNVGMLKEGVRIDRVRGGRQKYKRAEPSSSSVASKISFEHKALTEFVVSIEPEKVFANPDKSMLEEELRFFHSLADLVDKELVATIGWAKLVPGFIDLPLSDQMNLLQSTWLDIFLMNVAYRSMPYVDTVVFSDDLSLTEEEASKYSLPGEFNKVLRTFCKRVSALSISSEEHIYLKTILLFNPEAVKIKNVDHVRKKREYMQDHLQERATTSRGVTSVSRICSLIFVLASLVHLHVLARDFWLNVKREGRVPLHKLLSEMLEFMEES